MHRVLQAPVGTTTRSEEIRRRMAHGWRRSRRTPALLLVEKACVKKFCKRCNGETDRYPSGNCKVCSRRWHLANKDKARECARKSAAINRPRRVAELRERNRSQAARRGGYAPPETPRYSETDVCECCGKFQIGALNLDHDHQTGKFRGWLCRRCNVGIGCLDDSIEGVLRAAAYLHRSAR